MSLNVPFVVINLALVFYSIGVWSERVQGRLKVWHTVFFYLGLVCDTWGTGLMVDMAGGLTYDVHGLSGLLAIVLMFIHAVWATITLIQKDEKMISNFHKFSVAVWVIWLIPYFSPMAFRMLK
ncbi:MAG: HsmA family protein [Anaerolineales bacterium]